MQNQITAFGARFAWPLATVALAVAAGGLLVRMIHSGPWIDEFFTLYATDPGRSYAQLWAVLRHDNHPPLYNVLIWMLRRLTDLSIEEGRALNAVPLTACLAYWLWCFRAERDRPVLAVFLLLFLSAHQLQSQIADFRSYLWLIVTVSSLSLAAWRLLDPPQGRIGKADSAAFAISLFVTANLHYVGTLYAACLTAALLAALAHQQRFSLAGGVAAGALALASPAAIFALQQTGVLASRTGGVFWLKHDLLGGLLTIAKSVVLNVGANVAALAAAGLAAWGLSRQGLRRAAASLRPVELVLAASLTAFLAALLIVSLHTPVISARYLGLIAGPVSLLVALLACRLPRRRVVIAAVAANAAAFVVFAIAQGWGKMSGWESSGLAVKQALKACPTAALYEVLDPRSIAQSEQEDGMPTTAVQTIGYREMNRRLHLNGEIIEAGRSPVVLDRRCGAVLWLEGLDKIHAEAPAVWLASRGIVQPRGARLEAVRSLDGGVVVFRPRNPALQQVANRF